MPEIRPKILLTAENASYGRKYTFGRKTKIGEYYRKCFGRNFAKNFGRYNGRKLFRSHTILNKQVTSGQMQVQGQVVGSSMMYVAVGL